MYDSKEITLEDETMITSVQNNKVKQWNKLKKRKDRQKSQLFLIEGFHLVQEAIHSDWEVEEIIVQEGLDTPTWVQEEIITYVTEQVFRTITETQTPQGIAAVVKMKEQVWNDFRQLLLVDAVQDPGNLGTIIRTSDAAGFDGVILGEGTVDLYNDKVIRATQGSLFHLPIFQEDLKVKITELQEQEFKIWVSTLDGAEAYPSVQVPGKVALVVGNEGAGINPAIINQANQKVNIPIFGKAESLNVSVAAGILIYYIANNKPK